MPEPHLRSTESDRWTYGGPKDQEFYDGSQWLRIPVITRDEIDEAGNEGPLIVVDQTGTNVIEDGWKVHIKDQVLIISKVKSKAKSHIEIHKEDPYHISLFSKLFMQVAERMGGTLQRASRSLNIKERLDFSCAIFNSKGDLVANAPHIPVHLGSMSQCIRSLIENVMVIGLKKPYTSTIIPIPVAPIYRTLR